MKRYLFEPISKDLKKKMVFVSGPRQVGKTTLSQEFLKNPESYLNWDIPLHREMILKNQLPDTDLWIFDEIHKFRGWRNFLKGVFDQFQKTKRILVTGSAKLGVYRFGGDSLQGRYHHLRMHPLSIDELKIKTQEQLLQLFNLGGFPEPFFSNDLEEARRWSRNYRSLIIREEITSLEKIDELAKLELLILRLPELVGSPLSINSIREDLDKSHKVITNWLNILESLYVIFRLPPFGSPKVRAVKKEQKHYHFNWFDVEDSGKRFENFVACHLLKWTHYQQDVLGEDYDLRYFRDTDRREVDFVVTYKKKPIHFIECKFSEAEISRHLIYMYNKYPSANFFQIHMEGKRDFVDKTGVRSISCLKFFNEVDLTKHRK